MREIDDIDLADDDEDAGLWLDPEEVVDCEPPEESPETRRCRAASIVAYVGRYESQLPKLEWRATIAETRYRLLPTQETRAGLEREIRDLVACQVAMAHIREVAVDIAEGTVSYERGDQREFEGEYVAAMDAVLARIADTRPKQLSLAGWGARTPTARKRTRGARPIEDHVEIDTEQLAFGW